MTESRRSLSRALRAAARHPSVEPDPGFVDRLEQRLRTLDIHAVPAPASNVVALRRRVTRGAAIGVIAGVMTAAGAAAAAIVTVRHLTNPPPSTTTPPTTAPALAPLGPTSTITSAPTTVITTVPTPSTALPDSTTTAATITVPTAPITIPATVTTPPATIPETVTTPPATVPETVTTPPATTAPTPTTAAAVVPATDAPATTEARTGATMHLECTAVGSGIQCTWSAVPGGTDHVVLLRSTTSETRGRVLFPAAGATSMTDSTAVVGVTYTYLVHAVDPAGRSLAHSNAVTVSCCG